MPLSRSGISIILPSCSHTVRNASDRENLNRAWYKYRGEAHVPNVRFHDLRLTYAYLMLLQGIHPKIDSERLGHANIGITADTFSRKMRGLHAIRRKIYGDLVSGRPKIPRCDQCMAETINTGTRYTTTRTT